MVPPAVDDYCLSSHWCGAYGINGVPIFLLLAQGVGCGIVNNVMWCDAEGSKSS
jgi:hypothetical protein